MQVGYGSRVGNFGFLASRNHREDDRICMQVLAANFSVAPVLLGTAGSALLRLADPVSTPQVSLQELTVIPARLRTLPC